MVHSQTTFSVLLINEISQSSGVEVILRAITMIPYHKSYSFQFSWIQYQCKIIIILRWSRPWHCTSRWLRSLSKSEDNWLRVLMRSSFSAFIFLNKNYIVENLDDVNWVKHFKVWRGKMHIIMCPNNIIINHVNGPTRNGNKGMLHPFSCYFLC